MFSLVAVYCSVIHNSQEVEITQIPLMNEWIRKCGIYNGILFSFKKGNPVMCYNMDELSGYYAKWNKPVTERLILHDSTYVR